MPENFRVFVVDSDASHRQIIIDQLKNSCFQICQFADGEACLEALDNPPNLILLAFDLSGSSGLDICREIRAQDYDDIQVIFLTDYVIADDLIPELLLKIYEAGGNDFIHKYPNQDLLLRKINHALEHVQQTVQLQQQLNFTQQYAFTVMTNLGEVGNVLHFMRALNACRNEADVGKLLMDTLAQFSLKGLIKLDDGNTGEYYFCSDANCKPLEFSILGYASKKKRISLSADRMVLNYPHIVMLIMGLDVDNPDVIGRLRDHLAMIAEGTGIRIEALIAERLNLQMANARLKDFKELNTFLGEIEQNQQTSQAAMQYCTEQFHIDMESTFMFLGLTELQEMQLHDILDNYLSQVNEKLQNDSNLTLKLKSIIDRQRSLLAN